MAHYAKINDGIVEQVIVADINFFVNNKDNNVWIETFVDGALRKNFAQVGYTYDFTKDIFYESQPFASWTLNESTYKWEVPVAYPDDGKLYDWDEATTNWKERP